MIKVVVQLGIGAWTVHQTVSLCAAPHKGDHVIVHGDAISCDEVTIDKKDVFVRSSHRFEAEADLDEYVKIGWKR